MNELDELLDAWPDDDEGDLSDLHIHYHDKEADTVPLNELPRKDSVSPKAKRIAAIIIGVATGLATAAKIIWDLFHG